MKYHRKIGPLSEMLLCQLDCVYQRRDSRLDSKAKAKYCALVVKIPLYSEIKEQEAKHRRLVIKQRGSRSARAHQQKVSFVGNGAQWQITNLRQVAMAMAKWA